MVTVLEIIISQQVKRNDMRFGFIHGMSIIDDISIIRQVRERFCATDKKEDEVLETTHTAKGSSYTGSEEYRRGG